MPRYVMIYLHLALYSDRPCHYAPAVIERLPVEWMAK